MSARIGRRFAALVLTLAVGGSLAACAGPDPSPDPPPEARVTAPSRLAARLSMEQALARYEEMQGRIRDLLDVAAGPFRWGIRRDASRDLCGGEFGDSDGIVTAMAPWGFDGGISDADWPLVRKIVTEVTAEYGFETPTLAMDEPGRHSMSGADLESGATYDVGTEINTSMGVTTGCHLPAAKKGAAPAG